MSIVKSATEKTQSDFVEIPEGVWRWRIGKPQFEWYENFKNYTVKFPLSLTDAEKERVIEMVGDLPEGKQQSFSPPPYRVGFSLGYINKKDGQYKSTKLIDFLAVCFGAKNQRRFREWVSTGGKPTTPEMTESEEIDAVNSWLGWWEDLELYGSIKHEPDANEVGKVWPRFGGPLPVGSLPGQPEDAYQAFGLGKLRAMLAEVSSLTTAKPKPEPRAYGDVFEDDEPKEPTAATFAERTGVKDLTPEEIKALPF